MTEFEVTVHTKVKETYYVEAESAEDARMMWHNGEPNVSECIEVEDVSIKEATDD